MVLTDLFYVEALVKTQRMNFAENSTHYLYMEDAILPEWKSDKSHDIRISKLLVLTNESVCNCFSGEFIRR